MSAETKVGLFTFFGLVILGFSVYMLGNFTVSKGFDVKVYFKNVSGLPAKSNVKLSGVDVGKVKELKIDGVRVLAEVRINDGVIIYKNSKFTIAATSLIGSNYLQIDQGTPDSGILREGDIIEGISALSITDMLGETMAAVREFTGSVYDNGRFGRELGETLTNLRQLSGNLNQLVMSLKPYLSSSMQDVSELTRASKDLMAKIDGSDGLFTSLLEDRQMKEDVKDTLANVKQISEDAKKFIGKMAKFRMFWLYDARWQPNGGLYENDLFVRIVSNNNLTYYQAGIANLGNRDNMPADDKDYRGKPNQIDARLGFYNQWGDLAVGMIRGSGGAVLQLKPFYALSPRFIKTFALYGEFTDLGRNRDINGRLFDKPYLSFGVKTDITKNVNIGVRADDVAELPSLQFTAGISFEDKELASLLGLATLAK
ncbi:MAG: MlaD family protein [Elusimicrobiota bacterium]|jgi:phospholipid/cholesterol/gamma-HCH transport system substrate-binding protein|nr:MlaD family protein [Elusimicrobiota bacterium]